jgi:hypothetical protein
LESTNAIATPKRFLRCQSVCCLHPEMCPHIGRMSDGPSAFDLNIFHLSRAQSFLFLSRSRLQDARVFVESRNECNHHTNSSVRSKTRSLFVLSDRTGGGTLVPVFCSLHC